MTHDQYLDEPGDTIAWMLHIDALVTAHENEQAQQQQAG